MTPSGFPDQVAAEHPDRIAYLMARTGEAVTYRQLVERSRRAARVLRGLGAAPGDTVALFLENHVRFLELAWAAQRAGLRYSAISPRSAPEEVTYLLQDSGARVVVVSAATADAAREALARSSGVGAAVCVDAGVGGFLAYDELVAAEAPEPLDDEAEGVDFLYSSGTTGRPKAIRTELPLAPLGTPPGYATLFERLYGFGADTVYLSPAPLYHAAPLRFNLTVHRLGGTSVVMDRFEPAWALELVERHRITHTQMVPTMFVRLLRLSDNARDRDLSSLRAVIHAAAPCPPDVKRRMIEWLGPIVYEYYSATEVYLLTAIDAEDWLAHPGSVGRALIGTPHVLDDDGRELPAGEVGTLWSEGGPPFEYHGDPDKTAAARNDRGWATVGDVGFVDAEGYVYLTDRKADMIICGGVNVYPQEAENVLIGHPAVADAAVFGIPDEDLGEVPQGVVELVAGATRGPELAAELLDFCRARLAPYKVPRAVDFTDALPRQPTGKLYRRVLRDRYAAAR